MVTDGWLIVSATDAFHLIDVECFEKEPGSSSVFTRCEDKPRPVPPLSYPPPPPHPSPFPLPESEPVFTGVPPPVAPPPVTGNNRQDEPPPADRLYDDALRLFRTGNYIEVLQLLRPKVQERVTNKTYVLLARAHANLGQLAEALSWCDRSVAANKLDTESHYLRAVILLEQGRKEEAVQALRRCLYLDPGFILGHFTLGNMFFQEKNKIDARRHFNNALELLSSLPGDAAVSEEEGLNAGRMREIVENTLNMIHPGDHE
jgi:chemotaxis protein methyltransferase CheR